MLGAMTSLTGGGGLQGGGAGPATSGSTNKSDFEIGGISMGNSGSTTTVVLIAVVALVGLWILKK